MKIGDKYYLTVGEVRAAIEGVPDHVEIYINVEENNNENWDTTDASICNDSYLCKGEKGCTHTEPEMLWDIVLFVRDPRLGERSITGRGLLPDDDDTAQ